MPITKDKAPGTLPDHAKDIYVAAWNSAYNDTCKGKSQKERDACASKVAWGAVKNKYVKHGDSWVPKAALVDVTLTITKASLQEDGTMRWQAIASDTDPDRTGEATTLELFRDWIERVDTGKSVTFLPPPRKPFLGISHYPSLEGKGEAGITDRMYIDGNRFKISGTFFADSPLGKALFEAVRSEQQLIKRGEAIEQPIRISAGWWDLAHKHGDFVFERKSLFDICPMCEQGAGGKRYLQGQLDHFASTRVPINPRTPLTLEEKAMTKTTRKADAASIIGEELAEELEQEAKPIGKSETEAEPESPAMVTKADDEPEPDTEKLDVPKADVEKMDMGEEEHKPLGGALSLMQAEKYMTSLDNKMKMMSNWQMFQTVMGNIMTGDDPAQMKAQVKQLLDEFGSRVEAIKAAVEDAVLIEVPEQTGGLEMDNEEITEAGIEETVNDILADEELDREGKLAAIQEAFNAYGETVKAAIDKAAPPDAGETVKAALMPVIEKLDLIAQKLAAQPAQPAETPQQKSFIPKGPADAQPAGMQQPPTIRDIVRRSVGIVQ